MVNIVQDRARYDLLQSNPNLSKDEVKKAVSNVKKQYENLFWIECKAAIDYINPGYSSSTTGPNVQKAVKNPSTCATILNLDLEFVESIFYLCKALRSKGKPDMNLWKSKSLYVIDLYSALYSKFYNMTPSLHKILVHGCEMISLLKYGPAAYSEESQDQCTAFPLSIKKWNN